MTDYRYLIDTTKQAMAAHPGEQVIIDSHAGRVVVALCPIEEGDTPVCEGHYSFAPLVQRALEHEAAKVVFDGRLSRLVDAAFRDGVAAGRTYKSRDTDALWKESGSRSELKRTLTERMAAFELAAMPPQHASPPVSGLTRERLEEMLAYADALASLVISEGSKDFARDVKLALSELIARRSTDEAGVKALEWDGISCTRPSSCCIEDIAVGGEPCGPFTEQQREADDAKAAMQQAYDILCSGKPPHSARESNARRILRAALATGGTV